MTVNRYTDYDRFARVYNQHWGNTFTALGLQVMEILLLPHLPAKASILDLCCGTGQLARVLTARGYRVTGIDGSEYMIRYAQENAPGVEFIVDDARSFQLSQTFHAVISTFDSLNHIMTLEDLTSVFNHVYPALQEGGRFLFDLNMEEGYKTMWGDNFDIVEDDQVCVIRTDYNPIERIALFKTTIFYLDKEWHRSDITLTQKYHSEVEVISALRSAGFIDINAYAHNDDWVLGELAPDSTRAFFVCQKPSGENPV
ncbi:MAG: class I SAM-dependent methyltransferase [Dehalococcoidales bacterium]|nr:MAG: class I SAM-dependent methyltransferase [Dehalococcoidales bacterium]